MKQPYRIIVIALLSGLVFYLGRLSVGDSQELVDGSQETSVEHRQLGAGPGRDGFTSSGSLGRSDGSDRSHGDGPDIVNRRIPGMLAGSISPQGVMASGTAEKIGLNVEQREIVQTQLNELWKKASNIIAHRAIYDESASDPDNEIHIYRIPALDDRGEDMLRDFREGIAESVNNDVAAFVASNLNMQMFGGFGSYDVVLKFYPDQSLIDAGKSDNPTMIDFSYSDPDSGTKALSGSLSWKGFTERFGEWDRN